MKDLSEVDNFIRIKWKPRIGDVVLYSGNQHVISDVTDDGRCYLDGDMIKLTHYLASELLYIPKLEDYENVVQQVFSLCRGAKTDNGYYGKIHPFIILQPNAKDFLTEVLKHRWYCAAVNTIVNKVASIPLPRHN